MVAHANPMPPGRSFPGLQQAPGPVYLRPVVLLLRIKNEIPQLQKAYVGCLHGPQNRFSGRVVRTQEVKVPGNHGHLHTLLA